MANDSDEPWGQLVCTSDLMSDPIILKKNTFVLGRSKGADLSLIGNKLISGSHCHIQRDGSGCVWLHDTSSNGTLVNYKLKLQGEKRELGHGDEFHLVYRKGEDHLNISYIYQDLTKLKEEEEANETQDYSLSADDTSLTLPLTDSGSSPESRKRSRSPVSEPCSDSDNKKRKIEDTSSVAVKHTDEETKSSTNLPKPSKDEAKSSKDEEKSSKDKKSTEGMEENLICIICQEILHDCISCQPCMHSFCAGCYSDWMKRSQECPSCRLEVSRVNKNHLVNNLVEVYLKEHPDRRRPKEELDELDNKNKITTDMLKPPKPKKTMSEYIDDEDDDEDEDDEDDEDYGGGGGGLVTSSPFGGALATTSGGYFFSGMTGFGGTTIIRPPKTVCRQCPEYKEDGASTSTVSAAATAITGALSAVVGVVTGGVTSTTSTSAPSTSGPSSTTDRKVMPVAPVFSCKEDGQVHIMCQCCMKPMPDRRAERAANEDIPHQQCSLCYRMFCHMYWGCRKAECLGCLARFKELNFGENILSVIVLENTYESEILKDYMKKNSVTVTDLLKECCLRLEAGDYTCVDQVRGFTPGTVTCYPCGLRNFRDLAYQYRKDIPGDDLAPAARSRPDCYWGKNCRTQKGKMGHASKYNHICDQSRS